MTGLLIKLVLAYLLGSVSGSLLLGRFKGGLDVRRYGSGNAGATNALRAGGWLFALGVLIIDVGKGYVAAAWLPELDLGLTPWPDTSLVRVKAACGIAAVIGHCYPVFHGFRGGKGVGTLVGALLALAPVLLLVVLLAWLATLLLSGYVSVASMVAALVIAPAAAWLVPEPARVTLMVFGAVGGLFVLFTHRSNIRNLRAGTEYCFERIRLLPRS